MSDYSRTLKKIKKNTIQSSKIVLFLSFCSVMWYVQRAASDVDSFSSITKN